MGNQVIIWSSVILILGVILIMREAVKMRRHTKGHKLFELSDEFDIYDWDEE